MNGNFYPNKPEEDIIEQRVKGERRLLSGMIRTSYDSVAKFTFALIIAFFCCSIFLIVTSLTIGLAINCFYSFTFAKLIFTLFLLPASIVLAILVWKIFRRLIRAFRNSDKSFKVKSLLAISIPFIIFLLVVSAIFYVIWDYSMIS